MEKFKTVGNMLIKLNSNIAALMKPEERKDVFEDGNKTKEELISELLKNTTMGMGRKRRIATYLSNQLLASQTVSSMSRENLRLFLLLREWVREQQNTQSAESTRANVEASSKKLLNMMGSPQPHLDMTILAEVHLEYWIRQGVSADKYHLYAAKALFEQVVTIIAPTLGNHQVSQTSNCQILFKYIKVLQFLGEKETAAEVMVGKLLPNASEEPDYPNMLLCAGAIFKSRGMNEVANEHFFNAAQLGPPKFFNKIEMMIVISRTIEEMGGEEDANEDAYLMVFEHLKMEGHLQEDSDYDEWICNSKTWLDLGDKCAIHQLYSLASDFYALALLKDLDAFKKPMLWYRFAKSCYRCGKTSDSQLAVRQALAKSPFNLQLMRADRYWSKPPSNQFYEMVKSSDIVPIITMFPPEPDIRHMVLTKMQAVLRGIQERYNLQLGVGSRTDITRRMTAKVGMMLEDSIPIIIRVKPSWMGKITTLRIYDVRNDANGIVRLKTPFAPMRERHTPRRLSLTLEAIKETVTIRRRIDKDDDALHRDSERSLATPSSRRFHLEGQAPPAVQRVPFGIPGDKDDLTTTSLEEYQFVQEDDEDAEYEDVEEEFTQLIFKFTDLDTKEFSSRRMKIKINLDKLNNTELYVDDLNKYESTALKKLDTIGFESKLSRFTEETSSYLDSLRVPSPKLDWDSMSVANKGYSSKYTMSSRRNSTPKFKPKLFFNEARTLEVIDIHEEEDDYNVVTVTNIATCELLSACYRHNNDFYLIHAFNNQDLTTVTMLHAVNDVQIVFLVVREHIDRSNNMKKAWSLLCNIIEHNPILSMIVHKQQVTQEVYDNIENPCFIGNIHVFVNIMDKNCGATVILVNPSSTPILSHSFEVLTSTIVTSATPSVAEEISVPVTAANSRPISSVWIHQPQAEDFSLMDSCPSPPTKLTRSATSALLRKQPSMDDFLGGKVKAYSFSSAGSFNSSFSGGSGGADGNFLIMDAIKNAVTTVEAAIDEETVSEKIRAEESDIHTPTNMIPFSTDNLLAVNLPDDVSDLADEDDRRFRVEHVRSPKERTETLTTKSVGFVDVTFVIPDPVNVIETVKEEPHKQSEGSVVVMAEPEPVVVVELEPEPIIVVPPPTLSDEEIEQLSEGVVSLLYALTVDSLYSDMLSVVIFEHQLVAQQSYALMMYEQHMMYCNDYRIPESVKYIIGEASNKPTLSQLSKMQTRFHEEQGEIPQEYVCESIRSEVRGKGKILERDAFVFLPYSPAKVRRQPLSKPFIAKQKHKLGIPSKFDTADGLKRALYKMDHGDDDDSLESEGSMGMNEGFQGLTFELDEYGTPVKLSRSLPRFSKQNTGLSTQSYHSQPSVHSTSQRSVSADSVSTNLLIDQSAAYHGIKKLPLRDSNILLKSSTMNSLLKLDHIESLRMDNALARDAIYQKSMKEYIRLGYVDCSKPLAYNTHWKRKVNEFIAKFENMNALKKKIGVLKRLSPVELKSDEAICALAGTNGSVGEVVEKLKNLEYISEVRLVCASIHVKSMLMALMDYDDLSTSLRAESASLRTDTKGITPSVAATTTASGSSAVVDNNSLKSGSISFYNNNNNYTPFMETDEEDDKSYDTAHSQKIGGVIDDFTHDSEIGYNENPVKRRLKLQATSHSQLHLPHMNLSVESRLVQRNASVVELVPNSPLKHRGPSFSAGGGMMSSNMSLGSSMSGSNSEFSRDLMSLTSFQKKSSKFLPSLSPKPIAYQSRDDQYFADDEYAGVSSGGLTPLERQLSHVPMDEELSVNNSVSSDGGKMMNKSRSFYQGESKEQIKLKKMTSFRLDDRIETLLDASSDKPIAILCRRDALKAQQQHTLLKSDKVYIREHVEDKMTKLRYTGKTIAMNGKM